MSKQKSNQKQKLKQSKQRNVWSDKDDEALREIIKPGEKINWDAVRDQFKLQRKCNKSIQQIKERWKKHLNPKINKNTWEEDQIKSVFQFHKQYGSKWTTIAKNLKNRSDSDVKNHFYNALRKAIRKICKELGMKDSTRQVRELKGRTLTSIIFQKGGIKAHYNQLKKKLYNVLYQFSRQGLSSQQLQKLKSTYTPQLLQKIIDLIFGNKRFNFRKSQQSKQKQQLQQQQQQQLQQQQLQYQQVDQQPKKKQIQPLNQKQKQKPPSRSRSSKSRSIQMQRSRSRSKLNNIMEQKQGNPSQDAQDFPQEYDSDLQKLIRFDSRFVRLPSVRNPSLFLNPSIFSNKASKN